MKSYILENNAIDKDLPFTFGRAILNEKGFNIHSHQYSELVIIKSGTGIHSAEDIAYPVKKGDIFVIHKGMKHGFSQCKKLELFNLGFLPDFPPDSIRKSLQGVRILFDLEPQIRIAGDFRSRLHVHPIEMDDITKTLNKMERESTEKSEGFKHMYKNLFVNLTIHLGRLYDNSDFRPLIKMQRLSACIAELEERFDKPFVLEELIDKHQYSTPHFIRLFKKIFGITPLQYILQLRVDKATKLLERESLNISEIAYSCGFEDSNYFSRLFKKKTGLTPREFRKKIKTG